MRSNTPPSRYSLRPRSGEVLYDDIQTHRRSFGRHLTFKPIGRPPGPSKPLRRTAHARAEATKPTSRKKAAKTQKSISVHKAGLSNLRSRSFHPSPSPTPPHPSQKASPRPQRKPTVSRKPRTAKEWTAFVKRNRSDPTFLSTYKGGIFFSDSPQPLL